jgi:hypothetical protein
MPYLCPKCRQEYAFGEPWPGFCRTCGARLKGEEMEQKLTKAESRALARDQVDHPLAARFMEDLRAFGHPDWQLVKRLEAALRTSPHDDSIRASLWFAHSAIADASMYTGPKIIHLERAMALDDPVAPCRVGEAFLGEFLNWDLRHQDSDWERAHGRASLPCLCGESHPFMVTDRPEDAARQALAYFDRALELDPTDVQALEYRADALEAAGRVDEAYRSRETALRILNRAILADHRDEGSYHHRARILRHLGRPQEAIQDLERCLALVTDALSKPEAAGVAVWPDGTRCVHGLSVEMVDDDLRELRAELAVAQHEGRKARAKRPPAT